MAVFLEAGLETVQQAEVAVAPVEPDRMHQPMFRLAEMVAREERRASRVLKSSMAVAEAVGLAIPIGTMTGDGRMLPSKGEPAELVVVVMVPPLATRAMEPTD